METILKQLLDEFNVEQNKVVDNTLAKLMHNAKINALARDINSLKQQIIAIFQMYREKEEFKEAQLVITNANAKKHYAYSFDLAQFPNIRIQQIKNLDKVGLTFDPETSSICGVPNMALTMDLHLVFINTLEENPTEDIKTIPFIVNADPKDLWLNKPSNQNDLYAKADSDKYAGAFLDKRIVVASQRGRSHAHEGSFRDDHFYVSALPEAWSVVAVADGAGSAKFSRQGSKIATEYLVKTFDNEVLLHELNDLCLAYYTTAPAEAVPPAPKDDQPVSAATTNIVNDPIEEVVKAEMTAEECLLKVKSLIINILYKSVRDVHAKLVEFAKQEDILLKDLNTTLIFALVKKFDFGYAVLTFGVGDCPINVVIGDLQEVHLLNLLDIGEFGGGTRFITMPEIFSHSDMPLRFAINRFDDFSKLMLMTDGIYDAKFITENKLEDKETWNTFLQDLSGQNEDGAKVDFLTDEHIKDQLLTWLDFWSKGNHDDRTLAIIY
ncbi:hypothetical protein AAW12_14645 [Sphingobacterium sp. Ag1]|uniref:PP2C family serine/threonine-protein phosphatase n=1 Tax=Sphingobacterium sp. Ag1 TaxID=1643451 RepID=UPI000627909B|nr:PP2C family serine/threonine-protein phosphatase [Sphingobacterium sp. Ag1]KKO90777.1 hypothetical protein AAW12_14645 [Sphingobacterium sp. Ag1]